MKNYTAFTDDQYPEDYWDPYDDDYERRIGNVSREKDGFEIERDLRKVEWYEKIDWDKPREEEFDRMVAGLKERRDIVGKIVKVKNEINKILKKQGEQILDGNYY